MLCPKFLCCILLALIALYNVGFSDAIAVTPATINSQEWINYKNTYGKSYAAGTEAYALYYYNYNKKLVAANNLLADRNQRTYRLATNQFSDIRLITFNALFPATTQPTISNAVTPPNVQTAPPSFDPITDLGQIIIVEDQGTVCNSGWAYATAKAIEVMAAEQTGITENLSAQNLIDCAGSGLGCTRQVSQTAFDYLTQFNQPLYGVGDYPNDRTATTQGMCVPRGTGATVNLASYSRIANADDATMMRYVAASYPVVIEFDPTSFEFMHYSSGIFQQPRTSGGSHYMVVIGYGTDTTRGLDYWLVQNSFGTTWGEGGRMRIIRNAANPLARSALFPSALGP